MNLNDPRHPWSRLTAAARQATDDRDVSAPFGFATRVVARSFAAPRRVASLVDRFALRALGVAALVALLSAAVNYQSVSAPTIVAYSPEPLPADESIAIVLDLSAD